MNKQLRDEWVRALRSGEYEQGRGRLRKGNGEDAKYCCLGVLGVVCGSPDIELLHDVMTHINATTELLTSLRMRLIDMNDRDLMSFPEIADWIEANVPVTE